MGKLPHLPFLQNTTDVASLKFFKLLHIRLAELQVETGKYIKYRKYISPTFLGQAAAHHFNLELLSPAEGPLSVQVIKASKDAHDANHNGITMLHH